MNQTVKDLSKRVCKQLDYISNYAGDYDQIEFFMAGAINDLESSLAVSKDKHVASMGGDFQNII